MKRAFWTLILMMSLVLGKQAYALELNGRPSPSRNPATLEAACPSEDFDVFILNFSNDVSVQQAFTKYPLISQYLDTDVEPEPKKILQRLPRERIQFPILPLNQERNSKALEIRVVSENDATAQIDLIKADTDYQVSYFFEKDKCWRLVHIEDWSL